jgi:hypothetical protein
MAVVSPLLVLSPLPVASVLVLSLLPVASPLPVLSLLVLVLELPVSWLLVTLSSSPPHAAMISKKMPIKIGTVSFWNFLIELNTPICIDSL